MTKLRLGGLILLALMCGGAEAAGRAENRFGSIYIDGKKAGQIHYTIVYGDAGDVETLKTRASLTMLGIRLFNFEQTLHEEWRKGQLHSLRGRTDDDGKIYDAALERGAALYRGTVNSTAVEIPDNAFPASVWHYGIVGKTLLFDLKLLKLLSVTTTRKDDTLKLGTRQVPTERIDFAGDWTATAWFDRSQQLVQFSYVIDGHRVEVRLDD